MNLFPIHNSTFDGLINFEEINFKNPYDVNKTHRHNYFELILFSKSGGEQIIDFTKEKIKSNQISLIYPGQIHSLKRGENTSGIVIQFKQEFFNDIEHLHKTFLKITQRSSTFLLHKNEFNNLFTLVKFLKDRFIRDNFRSIDKSKNYVSLILVELFELLKPNNSIYSDDLTFRFLNLLEDQYENKKLIADYTSKLQVEARQLNKTLHKHLGKKALQLIHERIILEVRRLLFHDELTFKEIAYKLNFDSPSTFTRFVKKHTNKLPTELKDEAFKIHN